MDFVGHGIEKRLTIAVPMLIYMYSLRGADGPELLNPYQESRDVIGI